MNSKKEELLASKVELLAKAVEEMPALLSHERKEKTLEILDLLRVIRSKDRSKDKIYLGQARKILLPLYNPINIKEKWLSPRCDDTFQILLGSEELKNVTIRILNVLLNLPKKIMDVTFPNRKQDPLIHDGKKGIVDVFAKDEEGNCFLVEMQISPSIDFPSRVLRYISMAYASQLKSGEGYFLQKDVHILVFTDDVLFKDHPNYKSEHKILETSTHKCYFNNISIHCYEGSKFRKEEKGLDNSALLWLHLLFNIDRMDTVPEEMKREEAMLDALRALDKRSWSQDDLIAHMLSTDITTTYDYIVERKALEAREKVK